VIDLHSHSTASDGSLTPSELVYAAQKAGLSAIALTDHDTVGGLSEFIETAHHLDITAIPGIELAASWYHTSIHILGYGIDHTSPSLSAFVSGLIDRRHDRNRKIIDMLNDRGLELTHDDVLSVSAGATPGRPHIAQLLVSKGYVATVKDAFQTYIGNPHIRSIPHALPMPEVSIAAIHEAGGIASWAHPTGINNRAPSSVRKIARTLKGKGLDAIEGYYSEYSAEQQEFVLTIARDENLKVTGGSDFHGDALPQTKLGVGKGNLCVPDALLDDLFG
jgi:3',5'-nucleoside bisphosphate phosphatase